MESIVTLQFQSGYTSPSPYTSYRPRLYGGQPLLTDCARIRPCPKSNTERRKSVLASMVLVDELITQKARALTQDSQTGHPRHVLTDPLHFCV